jgi:hypothetical protein
MVYLYEKYKKAQGGYFKYFSKTFPENSSVLFFYTTIRKAARMQKLNIKMENDISKFKNKQRS